MQLKKQGRFALQLSAALLACSCFYAACSKKTIDLTKDGKNTTAAASTTDTIPTKNSYGVPNENSIGISSTGIGNWTNSNDSAYTYVTFNNTGTLTVSLLAKSPDGAGTVTVNIAGKSFTVSVPQSTTYQKLSAGSLNISSTGIYHFSLKGATKPGGYYADVSGIIISGSPANGAYYNKSDYRTCPAVHMGYNIPSGDTASWFYNEVKIPAGSDINNTFFMANGFYNGYFGLQVNPNDRRILFSIWSDYDTNDPGQVPANYAVQLVQKGSMVTTEENFGNEGTGRHAIALYQWHTDSTYKFLVHSVPDAGGVTYTGYIFLSGQWQLIAKYYKPIGTYNMSGLYSFIEDFGGGLNSYKKRSMLVQNQWIVTPGGHWVQLTNANFTTTTHDDVYSRVDYGAAASGTGYNYFTSGFVPKTASDNQLFNCSAGTQPVVTLPSN